MTVRFRVGDEFELAADVAGTWSGNPILLLRGGGQTKEAWGYTVSTLVRGSKDDFIMGRDDLWGLQRSIYHESMRSPGTSAWLCRCDPIRPSLQTTP